MFKTILILLCALLGACSTTMSQADEKGWTLVWADEFDGSSVDAANWSFEVNASGGGNKELQYYTDRAENCEVRDGTLVITARREDFTGPEGTREFTSSRLVTRAKAGWKYGRFEIRARLPIGQGIWPAIWMMPVESRYGTWAASGEIDIVELIGHEPDTVHGTLHYGGEHPRNTHTGTFWKLPSGTFAEDFHVFALEWEEGEFRWYVDGVHYQTQKKWHTEESPFPAPFNEQFFMILNLAVGGNWPGSPDETTVFPQTLEIDYVRVYQRVGS